uniref:Peptidase M12B domain-containing protein n=1 Tax=Strigamia maritima TaxID=126957 RepID=T1JDM1_STRMM
MVPEYEIIEIRSRTKRETDSDADKVIHVSAFGQNYKLQLKKNEHLVKNSRRLKVLLADVKDGHLELKEDSTTPNSTESEDVGDAYHDLLNEAAITLHHDNSGALYVEGTIGQNLVIKPIRVPVLNDITSNEESSLDDEMFLDDDELGDTAPTNQTDSSIHVVYKRKQAEITGASDYPLSDARERVITNLDTQRKKDFLQPCISQLQNKIQNFHFVTVLMEPDQAPTAKPSTRSKREAPDTIWPEVLVIADYDTYNMHGANSINIKRYFVSFWNGVDLRYKLLTGPRVRISLAGIIISKGRDATPYLEKNRVKGDAVDSAAALTDMGKYLFRERRLPTYDLAVVVTKLDLCRKQFRSGNCNTGTAGKILDKEKNDGCFSIFLIQILGFAYVGGACVVNSRLEKVNSVAIVEDTGGFSGIIVAAHEVGHLLGAVHDGSPAPNYLGGPGAEHCRWEDGYIMSDLRHTERGFQWSICSIQQFQHFLNSDTATCLHNMPHEDEELPRILPGRMLSLDAQCRKDRGTSACFKDDRVCAQLFCFDSKSGYCVSYRPAAEGSPCGDGQFCINGRCLYEHDNYIPDFTKISETIVYEPETAATNSKAVFSKSGVTVKNDNINEVTAAPILHRNARTTVQVLRNDWPQEKNDLI